MITVVTGNGRIACRAGLIDSLALLWADAKNSNESERGK